MSDILVIGGSIIGLCTALKLAAKGASVTLVDAQESGSGTASQGQGQLVVPVSPLKALYESSVKFLRDLSLENSPFLGADHGHLVVSFAEDSLGHIAGEVLDRTQVLQLEPCLAPDVTGGVLVSNAWQIVPELVLQTLESRCREAGVRMMYSTPVRNFQRRGHRWLIDVAGEQLQATNLVLSAGMNTAGLAANLGHRLDFRGQWGLWLLTRPAAPFLRGIVSEVTGAVRVLASPQGKNYELTVRFMCHQRPDGRLAVGSCWSEPGIDADIVVQDVLARAAQRLPALAETAVEARRQGVRPSTIDGKPFIGQLEPGLWVNAGHGGAGFMLCGGSAELLCDLIEGVPPKIDPTPYLPLRKQTHV